MQSSVIPIINFPELSTPDVRAPWANALKSGMGTYNALQNIEYKNYENQLAALNARYSEPVLRAKAQYAEPLAEANLQNAQLKPALTKAQTYYQQALLEGVPSSIALRSAQMELAQQNTLQKKMETQFLPEKLKSQLAKDAALTNYYKTGGSRGGVEVQNMNAFTNQLMADNPQRKDENEIAYNQRINDMRNAYLEDKETLPSGEPVPRLSGTANQRYISVIGHNAPTAIKNQATNYDVLYQDLKNFDIESVKKFAGPQGKAKLAYAKAQMVTNPNDPNIDPEARRFISSMNQAIYNMDTMRKAFGTSVVPEYVYATIGKLTNPASDIWSDSTQVGKNYEQILRSVKENRDLLMNKIKRGITYSGGNEEKPSASTVTWVRDSSGKLVRQ